MSDLVLQDVDSVHIKVLCEKAYAKELSDYFTFKVPNYQYTPAFRNKKWDGQIRLYNMYSQKIYRGLIKYVIRFAEDRGYSFSVKDISLPHKITNGDRVREFIDSLDISAGGAKIKPHDHQVNSITHAINKERTLILSPTGSGKSLIIYSLMRYYLSKIPNDKKILIIVPTTGLVSQMHSDFEDYSKNSSWSCRENCHTIYSGMEKVTEKKVVISTWQSIYKLPGEFFSQFDVVFGDECHLYKAKSLTGLMSKMKTCKYRIGTTGTLDNSQTHRLVIEGLFGPAFVATSTKDLMEEKLLSTLSIDCLVLKYNAQDIETIKRAKYIDEMKWLVQNPKRNKFIQSLSNKIKGNTLVLFNFVNDHGIPLYEMIKKNTDKPVFLIHGKTNTDDRENIRRIVDSEENAILVASYGTCSTGINIKNINNIIFASPSKSVIRVLQSIGRGLRKSKHKEDVKLFDISDDLSYLKWRNHTLRHLDERIKIYNNEKFNYKTISVDIRG